MCLQVEWNIYCIFRLCLEETYLDIWTYYGSKIMREITPMGDVSIKVPYVSESIVLEH